MVITIQEHAIYAESMKLRKLNEVFEKLQETGNVDLIKEVLQNVHARVPTTRSQIKLICSMLIEETWKSKTLKRQSRSNSRAQFEDSMKKSNTPRPPLQFNTTRSVSNKFMSKTFSQNIIDNEELAVIST